MGLGSRGVKREKVMPPDGLLCCPVTDNDDRVHQAAWQFK